MVAVVRILVTGADGFIGSHLAEALVRQGYGVRALAMYNFESSRGWLDRCSPDVVSAMDLVHGDVRDSGAVMEMVRGTDAVLHLAALIGIPYSYVAPESYVETNTMGTLNLLQAARRFEVPQFVHTSTSEVYGSAQYVPIDELHPIQAQSPYAASKVAADQLALSFWRSFETPVTVLRPFNTYGPRQSLRAVIPTVITQFMNGTGKVKLGSTTPSRDLTYVTDTVSAFISAIGNEEAVGEVLNLGTSSEASIAELVEIIGGLMGCQYELIMDSKRVRPEASEVDRLLSNNEKAFRILGWKPEFANRQGLVEGLTRTIEWFQNLSDEDPAQFSRYVV